MYRHKKELGIAQHEQGQLSAASVLSSGLLNLLILTHDLKITGNKKSCCTSTTRFIVQQPLLLKNVAEETSPCHLLVPREGIEPSRAARLPGF